MGRATIAFQNTGPVSSNLAFWARGLAYGFELVVRSIGQSKRPEYWISLTALTQSALLAAHHGPEMRQWAACWREMG